MIEVIAAGRSVSGRLRTENEDNYRLVLPSDLSLTDKKGHLIAIADGLGGHEAGQVASATALEGLVEAYYASTSPSRVEPALQRAVQAANLRVHDQARRNPEYRGMQTTLSCVALAGASAFLAHVGDSRVYLLREGALSQLTDDHSEAAELVRLRLARPELLADHPRRNVLTRTIGSNLLLRPDFRRLAVRTDDCFVVCTDGLWSEVSDEEIREVVSQQAPEAACDQLIEFQLGRASLDNATVEVVKVLSVDDEPTEADNWLNSLVSRFAGSRSARYRGAT